MQRVADRGEHLELSAFLVIIWYTYCNQSSLVISGVIRTVVAEATIYFLAMLALQTYIQLSLHITEVRSLSFLAPTLIADLKHLRVPLNNFRFCEYAINPNDDSSQLTVSISHD